MAQALAFTALSGLVSTGISYLFPSDGPRMQDIKVSASTYGNIIPEAFGVARVAANMIWATEVRETKLKRRAGKGGSFYNQYTYDVDFAMAFCVGPVDEIRRIWADGKLIYDTTGNSEAMTAGKFNIRIYRGTEDQIPDPLIEADLGVGTTPAHRGLVYAVFDSFQLADFGNRIPQMAAEVYRGPASDGQAINITPISAITDLDGMVGADFDRGYFYKGGRDGGTYDTLVRKYRISDGREISRIPLSYSRFLAVAPNDTFLIQHPSTDNYTIVYWYNSAGVLLGSYGELQNFGDDNTIPFSIGGSSVAYGASGLIYYLHLGFLGDVSILGLSQSSSGSGLAFLAGSHEWDDGWRIYSGVGFPANEIRTICARDYDGGSSPVWYCLHGGSGVGGWTGDGNLYIDKITVNGIATQITIPVTGTGYPGACVWDSSHGGVLFFYSDNGVNYLSKWVEGVGITWKKQLPGSFPTNSFNNRVEGGKFAFNTITRIYIIDTATGEWLDPEERVDYSYYDDDEIPAADLGGSGLPTGYAIPGGGASPNNLIFDARRGIIIANGTLTDKILYIGRASGTTNTLGDIVEALLRRTGLRSGDFDLTPLYEIDVPGYAYGSSTDVKSILQELKSVYLFDLVESSGRLVATVRGGDTAVETISANALGSTSENRADYWRETRIEEPDLTSEISLIYTNVDDDYEQSTARAKRIRNPLPTMFSKQVASFETNLILEADDAKTRVHRMLYSQWGERTKHQAVFPWALAYLDPSDLITVNFDDGRSYFERIHNMEMGADLSIDTETFSQDTAAYTVVKQGDGGGSGRVQVIPIPKPAQAFIYNLPLLRDVDDTGGTYSRYYSALGIDGDGEFIGASLYRSLNSEDYELLYSETSEVEWGHVVNTVPSPSHGAFALDWETQITIVPASANFELESATDEQMTQGANLCIIGNEVLQFRDCVENADGSWTIWNLYRGRRGTEWACDTHVAGEKFSFLDTATIEGNSESLDAYKSYRWFKGVGNGRSLNETDEQRIIYVPRDLMPYAPTQIEREITTAGIDITWDRRTRIAGGLLNGTGNVPLNEASEAYEVYILDAPFSGDPSMPDAPEDFVRKYEVTSPLVTYTDAEMSTDGFVANLDTLHVVIYQISAAVGRGFPGYRSIEAWRDS